jgi:hypothetical protein
MQSIATVITRFSICEIPLVDAQGYAQVKFLKGFSEDAKVTHNSCKNLFSLLLKKIFPMIHQLPIMITWFHYAGDVQGCSHN